MWEKGTHKTIIELKTPSHPVMSKHYASQHNIFLNVSLVVQVQTHLLHQDVMQHTQL